MRVRWALVVVAACGGKTVIDPPLDGSGGAGGTTTSTVTTTNVSATTDATTGPPPSDCVIACTALYQCGLEFDGGQQLCPGFTGTSEDQDTFLHALEGGGCVEACNSVPVIIALVDPADCPGTIANFQAANEAFADVCANGF
jgi:hypothetical protein